MIFCIDSEKHKRLSEIISSILKEIKRDEGIDAIIMNSYLIHESIYKVFPPSVLKDGINIKITFVVNDERENIPEIMRTFKSMCEEELHYNLIFSIIGSSALKATGLHLGVETLLAGGEILFDKTNETTKSKLFVYKKPNEEVITYEPKLNIRG